MTDARRVVRAYADITPSGHVRAEPPAETPKNVGCGLSSMHDWCSTDGSATATSRKCSAVLSCPEPTRTFSCLLVCHNAASQITV